MMEGRRSGSREVHDAVGRATRMGIGGEAERRRSSNRVHGEDGGWELVPDDPMGRRIAGYLAHVTSCGAEFSAPTTRRYDS